MDFVERSEMDNVRLFTPEAFEEAKGKGASTYEWAPRSAWYDLQTDP